jgi:hypothetical protein
MAMLRLNSPDERQEVVGSEICPSPTLPEVNELSAKRPIPAVQAATTNSQKLPVLVAELGAAFLCAEPGLGCGPMMRSISRVG